EACHKSRHESQTIPVYVCVNNVFTEVVSREDPRCSRCGGAGYLPQYWYYEAGICFKCGGNVISNGVFEKILNRTFNELDLIDTKSYYLRDRAKRYIQNLSDSELASKLPNSKDYLIDMSFDGDFGDDLPF